MPGNGWGAFGLLRQVGYTQQVESAVAVFDPEHYDG
jgi:hypothetical protein